MDQLPNPWWAYILLGLFAGIISGTPGQGNGTVVIPNRDGRIIAALEDGRFLCFGLRAFASAPSGLDG